VSTILMLGALNLTRVHERADVRHFQPLPLAVVTLTGAALAVATFDMPSYGDPNAPIHHHVADLYLHDSYEATHIPNVVTTVLASYRGYDTLGETAVVFTAAVGVLMLLTAPRRRQPDREEPK
jgi:multicomponent Na+:H+ antiporter subunit B